MQHFLLHCYSYYLSLPRARVYTKWKSGGTSYKFYFFSPTFPQFTVTDAPQLFSPLFRMGLPALLSHYVLFHHKLSSNFLHSSDHRRKNVHHHQNDLQKALALCILSTDTGLLVSTFMTGSKWSRNEVIKWRQIIHLREVCIRPIKIMS